MATKVVNNQVIEMEKKKIMLLKIIDLKIFQCKN